MADVGAIANSRYYGSPFKVAVPYWTATSALPTGSYTPIMSSSRAIAVDSVANDTTGLSRAMGSISGVVTTNGTATANVPVICVNTRINRVVAAMRTNASGAYSFSGLDASYSADYVVIAIDPTGANNAGRKALLTAG